MAFSELENFNYKRNSSLRRKIEIIDTIIALVILGISIACVLSYGVFKQTITAEIATFGSIGLFLITAFVELIPQVLNPYLGLIVAVASGLNVHISTLSAIMGSIFGSVLGFAIGKKYGSKLVHVFFEKETLVKVFNFWKKYGNFFVFLAAITPLPYLPLIFGALKMSKQDFVVYGIIPRILSLIVVGYGVYYGFFSIF